MCDTFARNGHWIEMLEEVARVPSPDVMINNVPADLKSISSYKQVVKHAKHATRDQNAEIVLFEFHSHSIGLEMEPDKVRRLGIRGYYYYSDDGKVHKL